jgi:hypothetical protein
MKRQTAEEKLLTAVLGPKEAAKLLAPPTYAYAYRSGHIGFGHEVPEGALPIGKLGPKLKCSTIEACARLSRTDNRTLFVPGVPEAESDDAALDAFEKWLTWVTKPRAQQIKAP